MPDSETFQIRRGKEDSPGQEGTRSNRKGASGTGGMLVADAVKAFGKAYPNGDRGGRDDVGNWNATRCWNAHHRRRCN